MLDYDFRPVEKPMLWCHAGPDWLKRNQGGDPCRLHQEPHLHPLGKRGASGEQLCMGGIALCNLCALCTVASEKK